MTTAIVTPPRKIGLAPFFNAVQAERGFSLAPHHFPIVSGLEDKRIENFLFLGPPGCLSAGTMLEIRRGIRNSGRPITIADAYKKLHDPSSREWDRNIPCFLPAFKGDRVGYHQMADIVRSGVKFTYTITTLNGKSLRATAEHPFRVPDGTPGADDEGFIQLKDLSPGAIILTRSREKSQGGRKPKKERRVTYGIIHHPHAWKKVVAGKDYKRTHYARLVVEAAMNGVPVDEFIHALKFDAERSATFDYLEPGIEVHHKDENPLNDVVDNLEILSHSEHIDTHADEKQKNFGDVLAIETEVLSVEPYGLEMTYDVVMTNPYRNYVAHDFIVHNTGKSTLLCQVYPAWELGHDPTLTILSVSAGEKLPQGFMSSTMQLIQHSKVWANVFPDVRPDQQQGWSIQRGLFVKGHHPADPDASYMSCGLSSKALTGLHARLHIYDDIHDRENSQTPDGRASVKATYYDTLLGRADPRGCRRIAAGRWWAPDDLYQEMINNGEWVVLQLPASRPGNARLWYDVFVPKMEDGTVLKCVYSETLEPEPGQDRSKSYVQYRAYYGAIDTTRKGFYWPASPTKRKEYESVRRRQPRAASINYDGDMAGGTESIFQESDFTPYGAPEGIEIGLSAPAVMPWVKAMHGDIEQAWDTALGQPQSESLTVALTGVLAPCKQWHRGEDPHVVGPCDLHYDVYLLDAMVKDIDFRELAMELRSQFGKWHPKMVTVEEKQSGVSLLQTFRGSQIPIRGQKVEQGKVERAVNAVTQGLPVGGAAASVQGWARMGRVFYPGDASWITHGPDGVPETGFIKKVCGFKGGTKSSDEFDALVHLVTRAILRSAVHGKIGRMHHSADEIDPTFAAASLTDPRRNVLQGFQTLTDMLSTNPFGAVCGTCVNFGVVGNIEWCKYHGRPSTTFGGCSAWSDQQPKEGASDMIWGHT